MTERRQNPDEYIPEDIRKAYGDLGEEPPPDLLDRAVLNRARAAVAPARSRRPWGFGWVHAVTTAAVVVLGVTVILQLPGPETGRAPATAPPAAAPAMEALEERSDSMRRSLAEGDAIQEKAERRGTVDELLSPDQDSTPGLERSERAVAEPETPALPDAPRRRARQPSPTEGAAYTENDETERLDPLRQDPERWLDHIRALVSEGQVEVARSELDAFGAAWPEVPIPTDLRLPAAATDGAEDGEGDSG